MTQAQRNVLLALAGLVALVGLGALVALLGGDGDGDDERVASAASTTSTADPDGTTTSSSSTTPTTAAGATTTTGASPPATTTTTSTKPADAPVVTADGALLRRPLAGRERDLRGNQGCEGLADPGFSVVDCGTADARGGRLAWLVQRSPTGTHRVVVLRRQSGRSWRPVLEMDDARGQVAAVGVRVVDLSGDGNDEIAFGFRQQGSGSILSVDVVEGGEVAFHRDLDHGSARVGPGQFDEWSARFAPGDPNCCPSTFAHGAVRFTAGAWRLVAQSVEPAPSPPSHL